MILGIGVDIFRIQRLEAAVHRSGKRFLEKVFTRWELEQAEPRADYIAFLAMRFAGKEAVFKTFGIGWDSGIALTEIEISDGKYGEPLVLLKGKFNQLASQRNVDKVLLSLSYDTEYAIGFAALIGKSSSSTLNF